MMYTASLRTCFGNAYSEGYFFCDGNCGFFNDMQRYDRARFDDRCFSRTCFVTVWYAYRSCFLQQDYAIPVELMFKPLQGTNEAWSWHSPSHVPSAKRVKPYNFLIPWCKNNACFTDNFYAFFEWTTRHDTLLLCCIFQERNYVGIF